MQRRFLIVDDHPLYANALKAAISTAMADVRVIHAATLGEAARTLKGGLDFELVILDLWLPDTYGFEGLIELRMLRPALPVLINSAFADPDLVHNAIACGAAGFISKAAAPQDLLAAINEVLEGNVPLPETYRPPQPQESPESETLKVKLATLTQQQLRVLQMLCQGLLNKQIAHELGVGEATVKAHVSEILRKLGVCSRTQAVLGISKMNAPSDLRHATHMPDGASILPFRRQKGGKS